MEGVINHGFAAGFRNFRGISTPIKLTGVYCGSSSENEVETVDLKGHV